MEELIIQYLDDNFRLSMGGLMSFTAFDKYNNAEVRGDDLTKHVQKAFTISDDDFRPIYSKWIDRETTTIQNKVVDYQTMIYKQTGVSLEVGPEIFRALDLETTDVLAYLNEKPDDTSGLLAQIRKDNVANYPSQ